MRKIILVFIILSFVLGFTSSITNAAGLVPCEGTACTWNHLYALVANIINFMVYTLALPLTVIFIVWGGFLVMTAGGSQSRFESGKQAITWAVIGLVVVLAAWLIISLIIQALCGATSLTGQFDISFEPWKAVKNCTLEDVDRVGP